MNKNWIWTDHIKEQIIERKLSKEIIETTLNSPDEVVSGKYDRQIYHKILGEKLIRIVADGNVLITVYITDKISKYMKGKRL